MDYRFRRQDAVAALILLAISTLVLVESWRMPRDLQNWPAFAGPGVVTGLLALALAGMAVALLVRALRRPGARVAFSRTDVWRYLADPQTRRLAVMGALCAGYLAVLGRGLPYHVATGAFLVVAMLCFRAARWWIVLLVSAATSAAIAFVFNRIFLVPLP